MKNLTKRNQGTITSLELLEQINFFRKEEGNRAGLRHDTLREIIKNEFEEEILSQKILEKSINSNGGRPIKIYTLTLNQAKQVLMRESKFVRRAVIHYIETLEEQNMALINNQDNKLIVEMSERIKALENLMLNMSIGNDLTKMTVRKYVVTRGLSDGISTNVMSIKANAMCKAKGIEVERVLEPRYQFINAYPISVLDSVYKDMVEKIITENSKKIVNVTSWTPKN